MVDVSTGGAYTIVLVVAHEQAGQRDLSTPGVRDRITELWLDIRPNNKRAHKKRIYYLSIEFLIGRLLSDSLAHLGLTEEARRALASFDIDLQAIQEAEPDAALGPAAGKDHARGRIAGRLSNS